METKENLLAERIEILRDALSGNQSLDSLLVGESRWEELSEYQQVRLFQHASSLSLYFSIILKNNLESPELEKAGKGQGRTFKISPEEARKQAASLCGFEIRSKAIKSHTRQFKLNDNKFLPSKRGKWVREWLLDQTDLKLEAYMFLKGFKKAENNEEDYRTVE